MSNNLYKTLKWLSDIRLVPLEQAKLLQIYPDEDLTFNLCNSDLDSYGFKMTDSVEDVFTKYFDRHSSAHPCPDPYIISDTERERILSDMLRLDDEPAMFA